MAEGIHVRGGTAFVETDEGCFVSLVCPDPGTLPAPLGCMGSDEQRTIDLSPFVPLLPGENPTSI